MYGGIFSLSLLAVSFFIIYNAAIINQNNTKQEIIKSIENIEKYIRSEGQLTEDILSSLVDNKYIEVNVVNFSQRKTVSSSFGPQPPFIEPKGRDKDMSNVREKIINKNGKEYSIEGEPGQEFMLVERIVHTKTDEYMVQAYKMLNENDSYIRTFTIRLGFIDLLGILCAFLIGKSISHTMLKPIESIRTTAERISIEDLSQRIDVTGPDDEMKELSFTFNSMIDRLEAAFKKQNQFISDASHELRTPISVIQGYANLINRWGKSDPTVLQESIDSIIAETEHMSTLVKKLLFLAKSDQNNMHIQKEYISLNQLTKDVVKEINVMEIERQIEYEETAEVIIFADADLIKQLLWIHAENSIKYTKNGSTIGFKVYSNGRYGCIDVWDNGIGMAKEDIPFLFDRFFRADKSRNKEIPGTGLGLSIAKWIIDSNEGCILVESEQGKGTRFINQFKLCDKQGSKERKL